MESKGLEFQGEENFDLTVAIEPTGLSKLDYGSNGYIV